MSTITYKTGTNPTATLSMMAPIEKVRTFLAEMMVGIPYEIISEESS